MVLAPRTNGMSTKRLLHGLLGLLAGLALAAAAVAPAAAQGERREASARRDQQQALWPADIVRLSNDYLTHHPREPAVTQVRAELERAQRAMRLLERREVRLYRADFEAAAAAPSARDDVRQAALGDKDAAQRLAREYERGDGGTGRERNRYVGWLQFAAALGSGPASYELALHYRREDQPALAAPYEARAEELGYTPPASLDHVRK
jgi:ribosomal protein L12E/L44/L45/RPP1/RPP2